MSDAAALITALVAAVGILGGGVKWLWDKIEKRFIEIENKLALCEERENQSDERRAKMWTIIEILMEALEDVRPDHRLLNRARVLLGELRRSDSEQHGEAGK